MSPHFAKVHFSLWGRGGSGNDTFYNSYGNDLMMIMVRTTTMITNKFISHGYT